MYDLKPGLYDVDVTANGGCSGLTSSKTTVSVNAQGGNVTGLVVRAVDSILSVTELNGKEEPKKLNGGNSKVRVVFDSPDKVATFRREGDDGEGVVFAAGVQAENGFYESPYAKMSPGTYEWDNDMNWLFD